jgi:hypothetical protein
LNEEQLPSLFRDAASTVKVIHLGNITITILDIIHRPVLCFKTKRFGDWILTSSSGGTYSVGPNRQTQTISIY